VQNYYVGRNKTKYIFNGLALLRDFERTFFHLAPLSECMQNYIYEEVTKAFLQHFSKRVDSFRVTGNSAAQVQNGTPKSKYPCYFTNTRYGAHLRPPQIQTSQTLVCFKNFQKVHTLYMSLRLLHF
jgi:hypothetical protein